MRRQTSRSSPDRAKRVARDQQIGSGLRTDAQTKRRGGMNDRKSLVTRTAFVFLPIRSFEKAEEFYGGVLGLPCSKRSDNALGGEFETGSLTIQVVDVAKDRSRVRAQQGRDRAARRGRRGRAVGARVAWRRVPG